MRDEGVLVSVIIPVHNVKLYLKEALDSVINQTFENLEIIIIDDGSTDGSEQICDYYAEIDERIIVAHQENRGLSNARNTGLDMVSGEYIAFLDSDDTYRQDFIEFLLDHMICEKADLAIAGYKICNSFTFLTNDCKGKIRPLVDTGVYDRATVLNALVDGRINISVWNKLYKRELWEDIRFPDSCIYEDNGTIFKIFNLCEKVYVLNRVLMYYRIRPGSITDVSLLDSISDLDYTFSQFEAFIKGNIPELFTEEQFRIKRQSRLNRMIYCYIWDQVRNRQMLYKLRDSIVAIGLEVGIDRLSIKDRILFGIIRYAPGLIEVAFPVYHIARMRRREAQLKREQGV